VLVPDSLVGMRALSFVSRLWVYNFTPLLAFVGKCPFHIHPSCNYINQHSYYPPHHIDILITRLHHPLALHQHRSFILLSKHHTLSEIHPVYTTTPSDRF
jgi:hypothetical protein